MMAVIPEQPYSGAEASATPDGIRVVTHTAPKSGPVDSRTQRLYAALLSRITQRAVIVVLIGDEGSGKTFLLDRITGQLKTRYNIVATSGLGLTSDGLLAALSQSVGVPPPDNLDEWRSQLYAALLKKDAQPTVVVIDDADKMNPSELDRAVLRLKRELGEVGPLKLILSGRPELRTALRRPCLKSLYSMTRIYLMPKLKDGAVGDSRARRNSSAGAAARAFSSAAIEAVAWCGGGVSRHVRALRGRALAFSGALNRAQIGSRIVGRATPALRYRGAPDAGRGSLGVRFAALGFGLFVISGLALALFHSDRVHLPGVAARDSDQSRTGIAGASAEDGPMAAVIRGLVSTPPAATRAEISPARTEASEHLHVTARAQPLPSTSSLARVAALPVPAAAVNALEPKPPAPLLPLLEPAAGPSQPDSSVSQLPKRIVSTEHLVQPRSAVSPEPKLIESKPAEVVVPRSATPMIVAELRASRPIDQTEPPAAARAVETKLGEVRAAAAPPTSPIPPKTVAGGQGAKPQPALPTEENPVEARDVAAPGTPAERPKIQAEAEEMRRARAPSPAITEPSLPKATNVAFVAPSNLKPPIRVFLHFAAGHPGERERVMRLADDLRRRGLTVADIRGVARTPRSAMIRFYYEADREHIRTLADALAAASSFAGTPSRWSVSDFTRYHAPPRIGNVEVWIAE